MSAMWDAASQMDLIKMILDKSIYSTSLCEGTVSNAKWILIVFLLKQAFFFLSVYFTQEGFSCFLCHY